MKHALPSATRKRQAGSVVVEAAFCLTFVLVPLFYFTFAFGKYYWYYTAAQKAVHDAALYMATAPLSEIKSQGAEDLALDIMSQETSDFPVNTAQSPSILCYYRLPNSPLIFPAPCNGLDTPVSVQAAINMNVVHPFFAPLTNSSTGDDSINLWAVSQMAYAGN
jgi:Flp pilus assembly protein TadG